MYTLFPCWFSGFAKESGIFVDIQRFFFVIALAVCLQYKIRENSFFVVVMVFFWSSLANLHLPWVQSQRPLWWGWKRRNKLIRLQYIRIAIIELGSWNQSHARIGMWLYHRTYGTKCSISCSVRVRHVHAVYIKLGQITRCQRLNLTRQNEIPGERTRKG